MSKEDFVILIALATGEEVSPIGLPVLSFYVVAEDYILCEGEELIKAALVESVKRGKEPSLTTLSFAVKLIPMPATGVESSERRRRQRGAL